MSPAPGWRRLLRLPLGERSIERDIDDELAFHLAMREEKLTHLGLGPDAARAEAYQRFGDASRVRGECLTIDRQHAREVRLMEWLESVWADVVYALRTFRRMPAFTAVAIVTLALGIGATTAMFTLVNGILLRPLPYPESQRLVRVIQSYPEIGLPTWGLSQQNIAQYHDRSTDFVAFAGYSNASATVQGPNGPQRLPIARVTSEFFRAIGVGPMIGRAFSAEEDAPGKNTVAILSYGAWQTRFGGMESIIGTTMDIDGQPCRIIGVMPQGFAFPRPDVAAWLPMGLDPNRRFGFGSSAIGRLKPGVTPEHAQRQTTMIMWDWGRENWKRDLQGKDPSQTQMKTIVVPLQEAITTQSAKPLTVLLVAVGLILLIATANVATLLSGRAAARTREISLRSAIGATGGRVVRQLLTESVALALLGAIAGVTLAFAAVRLFTHSGLATLPRINEVGVDWRVLVFTLVISVGSGLLFGLLPALHARRLRLSESLAGGQRGGSRKSSRRVNDALVVVQLSLSVVLLIAAGLVLKSFQRMTSVELGFRPDGVTAIGLWLPRRIGLSSLEVGRFMNQTLERVRAIPGVQSAGFSAAMPIDAFGDSDGLFVEGHESPSGQSEGQTRRSTVSPGYFKTVGIPLLFGRDFATTDDSTSMNVAVVDEALASRYWKGSEALGKRVWTGGDTSKMTIIGVVGSIRDQDVTLPPAPHLYRMLPQAGAVRISLALRTSGAQAPVIAAAKRAIAEIEPSLPLDDVKSFSSIIEQSFASRRLTKLLLGGFACVGLLLAIVGIYGVMSLHVATRAREFGIRLAIGAEPGAVLRHVLGEGAVLAGLGVTFGIGGAVVLTRWIASLLYQVSPTDPVVLVALPALLASVSLAACYIPGRRAARSDPLAVLRAD